MRKAKYYQTKYIFRPSRSQEAKKSPKKTLSTLSPLLTTLIPTSPVSTTSLRSTVPWPPPTLSPNRDRSTTTTTSTARTTTTSKSVSFPPSHWSSSSLMPRNISITTTPLPPSKSNNSSTEVRNNIFFNNNFCKRVLLCQDSNQPTGPATISEGSQASVSSGRGKWIEDTIYERKYIFGMQEPPQPQSSSQPNQEDPKQHHQDEVMTR